MEIEQPWINAWINTPTGFTIAPEGIELIRKAGESSWARQLLIRFPPWSLVRSLSSELLVPARGTLGVVVGHGRPTDEAPHGFVTVKQHPEATLTVPCRAELLEVAHYVRGIEPAVVEGILQLNEPS